MDRAEYAEDGRECKRSPLCQLIDDHGSECDPRTEAERAKALHRHLDLLDAAGVDYSDPALEGMVDSGAKAAMACALAGGRSP